jgi:hypothetical protein
MTGSPVTECELSVRRDSTVHTYQMPGPPSTSIWRYDEDLDEDIYVRERTAEEMADVTAKYEAARAEWYRTGGQFIEEGPIEASCSVKCADGSKGEGVWTGSEWRWMSWNSAA